MNVKFLLLVFLTVLLSLTLVHPAFATTIFWGNDFGFTSREYFILGSSTDKISFRFKASASKTVDKVKIDIYGVGVPPTYRVGIQGDNAGVPDGTFLGYADVTPAAGGWQWLDVDITNVSITQDTYYHVVVQYQSGTVDASNKIYVKYVTQQDLRLPYDLSTVDWNVLTYVSSWSTLNKTPDLILVYTDLTIWGQPWNEPSANTLYGTRYFGEQFQVPENKTISHIGFYMCKVGTPSAFYISIYNVTDGVYVLDSELVTETIGTSCAWVDHALGSNINLVAGKTYQVWGESPSSDSANYYQLQFLDCLSSTVDDATYYGDTICKYAYSTTGEVPLNTFSTLIDLKFRFTTVEGAPTTYNFYGSASLAYTVNTLKTIGFNRYGTSALTFTIQSLANFVSAKTLSFFGVAQLQFTTNILKQFTFNRYGTSTLTFTIESLYRKIQTLNFFGTATLNFLTNTLKAMAFNRYGTAPLTFTVETFTQGLGTWLNLFGQASFTFNIQHYTTTTMPPIDYGIIALGFAVIAFAVAATAIATKKD
jgi:hypothetical protein